MNILSVDLTKQEHFIALNYEDNKYCFEFQTADWDEKIDTLSKIENFDFKNLNCCAYAAGPGSFTGARLAFTFLNTLKLVHNLEFFAFSNLAAMNWKNEDKIAFIPSNNNDFYYRENNKDTYTQDFKKIESLKNKLLMMEGFDSCITPKLLIKRKQIAINIIDMVMSELDTCLDSNEPNYLKNLTYRKING